jgi:lipoyl(octanoyl) transferase
MELSRAAETRLALTEREPESRWQLWVDDNPRPGWVNMSIDQTLLERADHLAESWLRLYQWEPQCLSFGRNEPASTRYSVDAIRSLGLDTVRRPTGGRAVLHSHELTYAVAMPVGRFGSLRDAYQKIHQMLADALRLLGANVFLAPRKLTPPVTAGACFSHAAGGEIMSAAGKVVGSAQYRYGRGLLQHGSILLEDDQRGVHVVTVGADSSAVRGAPLSRVLGRSTTPAEVCSAIGIAGSTCWEGMWDTDPDSLGVLQEASPHFPRFRSEAWTWSR